MRQIAKKLQPEFENFLHTIKRFEKSRFQTRSFEYLDIISWVESKVYNKPMSQVIRKKYLDDKRSVKITGQPRKQVIKKP